MSILPTNAHRPASSSSSALRQSSSFNHGLLQPSQLLHSPHTLESTDSYILGPVSASQSFIDHSIGTPGSIASSAASSSGSSKRVVLLFWVNESRTSKSRKSCHRQSHGTSPQFQQDAQLRYDQGVTKSAPIGFHGNYAHPAVRRNHTMNGNHLLNFQYDPISRSQPRMLRLVQIKR